jgi:glycosyltransferase involved in cell wall biosynthesis
MKTNYSDEAADIITGFGGSYQIASYRENSHKMRQLKISTTCIPGAAFKKTIGSKNKFMWYAGYGAFHKGLDLVVEAFIQMPEKELHIFGNIESNKKLYAWFLTVIEKSRNITYHGWATPDSAIFQEYAQLCDAVVYASSSEGGPGAIIQCMQFGLVPILNRFSAIDPPRNTFNITGNTPEEEIDSIVRQAHAFSNTPAEELQQYSDELALYYSQNHTIERYVSSLKAAIEGN